MVKRIGGWLPEDPRVLRKWINKKVQQAKANPPATSPVVAELNEMILNDPQLYMLFTEMLTEVPAKYAKDPSGQPEIRDVPTLMQVLDLILTEPPSWNASAQIGTPINAILDWPMGTKAGFAAFLNADVNAQFQKLLSYWGQFLLTPASVSTLTTASPNGWFSPAALNSPHMRGFTQDFAVDLSQPAWGFPSWDVFFTRPFLPGRRPVAAPTDDSIIASAAEATPFAVQNNVQLRDTFWLKGQPYSLAHMLANDPRAEQFVGGTVYQAFLSADSYHRWHAPVAGKIVSSVIVPGTYYSEPLLTGFSPDSGWPSPDPGADEASQGYISAVATRGVIFIEADNADIGLVVLVMIGMAEVSSVDITMPVNQHFDKGDQLGMFHFGGSSHCLLFGPQVQLQFMFPDELPSADNSIQWPVSSALAQVLPKK